MPNPPSVFNPPKKKTTPGTNQPQYINRQPKPKNQQKVTVGGGTRNQPRTYTINNPDGTTQTLSQEQWKNLTEAKKQGGAAATETPEAEAALLNERATTEEQRDKAAREAAIPPPQKVDRDLTLPKPELDIGKDVKRAASNALGVAGGTAATVGAAALLSPVAPAAPLLALGAAALSGGATFYQTIKTGVKTDISQAQSFASIANSNINFAIKAAREGQGSPEDAKRMFEEAQDHLLQAYANAHHLNKESVLEFVGDGEDEEYSISSLVKMLPFYQNQFDLAIANPGLTPQQTAMEQGNLFDTGGLQ